MSSRCTWSPVGNIFFFSFLPLSSVLVWLKILHLKEFLDKFLREYSLGNARANYPFLNISACLFDTVLFSNLNGELSEGHGHDTMRNTHAKYKHLKNKYLTKTGFSLQFTLSTYTTPTWDYPIHVNLCQKHLFLFQLTKDSYREAPPWTNPQYDDRLFIE